MESARAIFERNLPSGPPIHYGTGDYFYVLANGSSPNQLVCIDKSLLTAGNYLGAGAWTTNPVIANISLSTTGYVCCVYNAITREVWVSGSVPANTKCVDANPVSPTFNTVVRTLSTGYGISGNGGVAYNSRNNKIHFGGKTYYQVDAITGLGYDTGIGGTANHGKFFEPLNFFLFSDETLCGYSITPEKVINFFKQASGSANTIGIWGSRKYIYFTQSGSVEVFDHNLSLVSTISLTNCRCTRSAFSENNNKLLTGSFFSNSFSFLNELTLTSAGNLAKGYTAANEAGTREIVASNDVAIALPDGVFVPATTFTHIHAIDVSAQSYIGYVPLGATLGSFTSNEYNGNMSCKNRIEV